jgi:predicted DNA-binding ribbon-helix-helix protein
MARLVTKNIIMERHRTSMRLEPELWDALDEVCRRESISPGKLVMQLERDRPAGSRTSALRVFLLTYFRSGAAEKEHAVVSHDSRDAVQEPVGLLSLDC